MFLVDGIYYAKYILCANYCEPLILSNHLVRYLYWYNIWDGNRVKRRKNSVLKWLRQTDDKQADNV